MREYDLVQAEKRLELEARKDKIYKKVPRILEIDQEISLTGIRAAKSALSPNGLLTSRLEREKSAALKAEKAKLFKQYNIPDNYLEIQYECHICKDTGYNNSKKCKCFKLKQVDKHYELSNLKQTLKDENFDMFDFGLFSDEKVEGFPVSPRVNMQKIFTACNNFTKDFLTKGTNIIFSGGAGLGKTFMCRCIAKDVMDAGHYAIYVTAPDMFKEIEAYKFSDNKTTEMAEAIGMLIDVDLLIIDDLGSEFNTVITSTELFNIINSRMITKKSTVISTNLSEIDLQRIYSDRLFSRFIGNYEIFYFFGDDIRIKKKLLQ